MKKLFLMLSSATVMLVTSATAADDPIAARKAIMQSVGAAAGLGGAMLKGEMDYNPKAGKAVMTAMHSAAIGIADLFPAGSETGGKTTSSPKIWEDMAGFKAALAKFEADAGEGASSDLADKAAFQAAFGKAAANCKSCHEGYRVKK
ncbi:MAG: cytochrome c [Pseudomonadota bacterium]